MSEINGESTGLFVTKHILTGGIYGWCYTIGNLISNNPEFKPSYYKGVYITKVWISLKKIAFANHWAVVFKLSNGKYGIVQFDTSGKIGLSDTYNSLEEASLKTWGGLGNRVRLSCYGSCYRNYIDWVESFYGKHTYVLGSHDCQNFAREVVEDLTDKTVGVWPIEDGPTFGQRNVPDLDQIAKDSGSFAATFCAIHPFYWLGRLFAD